MTRMFEGLKTWNPCFGCLHNCYQGGCWAKRRLAHRMGARFNCSDCHDFLPHIHEERLNRIPRESKIFVNAHSDGFGRWWLREDIERVLEACRSVEKTLWFFESKNPLRFLDFADLFPDNTMLSTTVETNRTYPEDIRGNTPTPFERVEAMRRIVEETEYPIHISIEPILDFDIVPFLSWMRSMQPMKVAVGYDSLNNGLPEPPKEKTLQLIDALEDFTVVERKQIDER